MQKIVFWPLTASVSNSVILFLEPVFGLNSKSYSKSKIGLERVHVQKNLD